jgi:hypothetical protein
MELRLDEVSPNVGSLSADPQQLSWRSTTLDEPTAAKRANAGADVVRQHVALQEAEKTTEKAKADLEVARNESEAAKRDAQLAKAETERLSAERIKLNAALEQLETEKTAAEAKAHVRRIWRDRRFDRASCNCLIRPFCKSEKGNSSQEGRRRT